jgi:hypothetical protein
MTKILIPATNAEDWKQFLAEPEKHWKTGYSARALAYCWQEADGIPSEMLSVLERMPALRGLETLFAIPEHKVPLPGGRRPSQNDVWVLAKSVEGLVSIAVEGKVSEPFGPTVGEWLEGSSTGKQVRLRYLCDTLNVDFPPPEHLRYQLFHRTASAVIEAERLGAPNAVMAVHSFSPTHAWLDDYQRFLSLFRVEAGVGEVASIELRSGVGLFLAWIQGDARFLDT